MPKTVGGVEQNVDVGIRSPNTNTGTRIGSPIASSLASVGNTLNALSTGRGTGDKARNDAAAGKFLTSALTRVEGLPDGAVAEFNSFRQSIIKSATSQFGLAAGKSVIAAFDEQAGMDETTEGGVRTITNRFTRVRVSDSPLSPADSVNAEDIGAYEGNMPNASTTGQTVAQLIVDNNVTANIDDLNAIIRSGAGASTRIIKSFTSVEAYVDPKARANARGKLAGIAASEVSNVLQDLSENDSLIDTYHSPGGPRAVEAFVRATLNDMYDSIGVNGFASMDTTRADFTKMLDITATATIEAISSAGTANARDKQLQNELLLNTMRSTNLIQVVKDNPGLTTILLNPEITNAIVTYAASVENINNLAATDPTGVSASLQKTVASVVSGTTRDTINLDLFTKIIPASRREVTQLVELIPSAAALGPTGFSIIRQKLKQFKTEFTDSAIGGMSEAGYANLLKEVDVLEKSFNSDLTARGKTIEEFSEGLTESEKAAGQPGRLQQIADWFLRQITDTSGAEIKPNEDSK